MHRLIGGLCGEVTEGVVVRSVAVSFILRIRDVVVDVEGFADGYEDADEEEASDAAGEREP